MKATIRRTVTVQSTARVKQMRGLFDVAPAPESVQTWDVDLSGIPAEWNVGVIVGPSGAGKTTVAKELFGRDLVSGWPWPDDKSILDGFPAGLGIKDITGLLSSVGFSSPPYWLRPFHVLSNGQQFRVNLARTLAEYSAAETGRGGPSGSGRGAVADSPSSRAGSVAVVDEFTSVVDRTVAQIGSAAVAKTVRRRGQRFVAVTCHYDVLDWLEPDWVYEPHVGKLTLNAPATEGADAPRGLVRRPCWNRPAIELEIVQTDHSVWPLFQGHHYLTASLSKTSYCFVGLFRGQPAVFTAVCHFPHPVAPAWREHRTVCLPDFQGVGIGNAMSEFVASMWAAKKRYTSTTSHPAMIRHRARSPLWRMSRKPSMVSAPTARTTLPKMAASHSGDRITASFEYVGPKNVEDARRFGLLGGSGLDPRRRTSLVRGL